MKWKLSVIFILILVISLQGCITKRGQLSDEPDQFDPTVTRYIKTYGPEYTVTQDISTGTPMEIMTWHAQGIRIKYVMETGLVVREENFDPNASSNWIE